MKKVLIIFTLVLINATYSYAAIYNQDNRVSVNNILKTIDTFEKNANSENGIKTRKNILNMISLYGANKSAEIDEYILGFIFHMVKLNIGEEKFNAGLIKVKNLKEMPSLTYLQILRCFEGIDAESFYDAYFNKNPLIKLNISNAEYITEQGRYYFSFTILRRNGDKFINLPYVIEYGNRKEYGRLQSSIDREETFKVPVELGASVLYIDPNYHILRELGDTEKTPVIAEMLVKDNITYITKDDDINAGSYFKITETLKDDNNILFSQIENKNVIINGYNNKIAKFFTDKNVTSNDTSQYYIFKNPQNKEKYILIMNNPKDENLRLLSQYGMNEEIVFKGSSVVKEYSRPVEMGLKIYEHKPDTILAAKDVSSFDLMITKALPYKNIFVGETHTEYSHHATQLAVIEQMYKRKKKIAIAMEMVQVKYLDAINDFVRGRISEKEMLENIKYYENWSYDYSLYAPIFKFARDNNIDIIPLNIPRDVTSKVFNGSIDNLTLEEKSYLPAKMNVVNDEYESRLYNIFSIHADDSKEFNNFYLSQNIWDEVMAKNMADYRKVNPDTTIITICGNGHAGKNSGIPYRYKRITGEDSFVIIQGDNIDSQTADYFIYPEDVKGNPTPKIGVTLENKDNKVKISSVAKKSPAEKAGLKTGDEFIKCGYHNIENIGNLKYALYEKGYNAVLKCDIKRGKDLIKKQIKLVDFEDESMDEMMKAHMKKFKEKNNK